MIRSNAYQQNLDRDADRDIDNNTGRGQDGSRGNRLGAGLGTSGDSSSRGSNTSKTIGSDCNERSTHLINTSSRGDGERDARALL